MVYVSKCPFILVLFLFFTNIEAYDSHKWIVVTTIQYPTPALQKLARLPDWHMVVVADKKTPPDWHLDNCTFLSIEAQEHLPYSIVKLLPWNHYCRKNIGYLYAIEHGATLIYETDDDNVIISDDITYLDAQASTLQYQTTAHVINPYNYFWENKDGGQKKIWPRGYPLSSITENIPYMLQKQYTRIPIQQGLVNNDPDVDAIHRLIHDEEITFNGDLPAVSLPIKTMCPFNSQNTLFHYDAFWGLLLPMTTSFRVCDIWRSYWVQRMLWDINAALCFLSPTAIQYRNEHDLLKDFKDELDLYLKAEKLIKALNNWNSHEPSLATRISMLMQTLVDKKFFRSEENLLMQAWLSDLESIHYKMPAVL